MTWKTISDSDDSGPERRRRFDPRRLVRTQRQRSRVVGVVLVVAYFVWTLARFGLGDALYLLAVLVGMSVVVLGAVFWTYRGDPR